MTTINLFRGQVVGPKVENLGGSVRVTLDCEDYNRLFARGLVGASDGVTTMTQDDGTRVPIDPFAINSGAGDDDVFKYLLDTYWPGPALDYAGVTHYRSQSDIVSWQTALSDLQAICQEWAARTSGALRFWVDADLVAHWRELAPTDLPAVGFAPGQLAMLGYPELDPSGLIFAPYELDSDSPDGSTSIMPMTMSASWDWAAMTRRVYVKGATPAPEGSGWVWGTSYPDYAGDAYVDAPGSITAADREAIGRWHLQQNMRELLTGSASIPSGRDGWRVGQTLYISDATLSQVTGHTLARAPTVIQRVSGRRMGPGGLGISLNGSDISHRVVIDGFAFEETLGSAGKATVALEIVDGSGIVISPQSEILITTDGTADLEYDLEFGDVPAGALPRELAQPEVKQPANRFIVTVQDSQIPVGGSTLVTAQLCNAAGAPLAILNVYLEWVLLQWAHEGADQVAFWQAAVAKMNAYIAVYQGIQDRGGTLNAHQTWAKATDIVTRDHDQVMLDAAIAGSADAPLTAGTGYSLDDLDGVTDATGRAFTRLNHDTAGTTVTLTIDALALPIA